MKTAEQLARHVENQRRYIERHRERALESARRSYRAHAAERIEDGRAWRAANPERVRANTREWKRRHRAEQSAAERRRRDSSPVLAQARRAATTANRKARLVGADGVLTIANVLELWTREPSCVRCGEGRGLDHIRPFARGGHNTTGNLQNLCHDCNAWKGTKLPEEIAA